MILEVEFKKLWVWSAPIGEVVGTSEWMKMGSAGYRRARGKAVRRRRAANRRASAARRRNR